MLDRNDIENLEFIGIGLDTTQLSNIDEWLSPNDLKYISKIANKIITQDSTIPKIKQGKIEGLSVKSNGHAFIIWIKSGKDNVYLGNLSKFNRLDIKPNKEIHYREFKGINILCNIEGDILTL